MNVIGTCAVRLAASPLCCSLSLRAARSTSGTMTSRLEIANRGHYAHRRVRQPTYYERFRCSRNFLSFSLLQFEGLVDAVRITLHGSIWQREDIGSRAIPLLYLSRNS